MQIVKKSNTFQAVTYSVGGVTIHGLVTPTLMIWTSTECRQACKSLMADILPFFNIPVSHDSVMLSKRDRALRQARLATEWRRQQTTSTHTSRVVGGTAPMNQSQTATHILSNMRLRQSCQPQEQGRICPGANDPVRSCDTGDETLSSSCAKVILVAPVSSSNPKNNETQNRSEIMLKCTALNLIKNIDDPVKKIDCFKSKAFEQNN